MKVEVKSLEGRVNTEEKIRRNMKVRREAI